MNATVRIKRTDQVLDLRVANRSRNLKRSWHERNRLQRLVLIFRLGGVIVAAIAKQFLRSAGQRWTRRAHSVRSRCFSDGLVVNGAYCPVGLRVAPIRPAGRRHQRAK